MSTDVEVLFNPADPTLFDLFAIKYLILPNGEDSVVPATRVATIGLHTLYRVETSGYLGVVDVLSPITADRTNLAERVEPFMNSELVSQGRFPAIDFAGGPPPAPVTLPATGGEVAPPGTVESESAVIEDGIVVGEVNMDRAGMVLLKASFDLRWTVEIDGQQVRPQMIAPSFVGRVIPAGHHSIVFRYHPFPRYDVLLALGALVFMALHWGGAVARGVRSRPVSHDRFSPPAGGGSDGT
jgi:hypothetical protein